MGFSLIELLVSMAVVTILLASGMPGLQQTSQRLQMQVWSERILVLLQQRKAFAMAENDSVAVEMSAIAAELPNGLRLDHNFRLGSPLLFEGNSGFARAGSIELSNAGYGNKIIISGLGRIRRCQSFGSPLPSVRTC